MAASSEAVPPRLHFYRAFRAALKEYLKATVTYRQVLAEFGELFPGDPVQAELAAASSRQLKVAMGDQKFFAMEVQMYALAYLVEAEAERHERVYREEPT